MVERANVTQNDASHITSHTQDITGELTEETLVPATEYEFNYGGARYYQVMHKSYTITDEIEPVLIETCRTIDRLDQYDKMIRGRDTEWVKLRKRPNTDDEYTVVMNGLLREARETATTLKGLVSEIRAKLQPVPAQKGEANKPKLAGVAGIKDELLSRRTEAAS